MVVQCQGCNFAAISCRYIEEHFLSRGGDICFDFHVPKCFKLLTFQSRLFQKRFARTKFDIFVFFPNRPTRKTMFVYCVS